MLKIPSAHACYIAICLYKISCIARTPEPQVLHLHVTTFTHRLLLDVQTSSPVVTLQDEQPYAGLRDSSDIPGVYYQGF